MAQQLTLEAQKRETIGSGAVRRLRKDGVVPAIVYGGKQRTYPIQVNARRIGDILKNSASEQILVTLQIEGADEKEKMALIQDIQHDHISGQILHIDFNAVQEDTELHVHIPIELEGEPEGVKHGGVLEQLLRDLPIACLPKNLPELFHVNVEALDIGDGIHIDDLQLPEGVRVLHMAGDVLVASVAESRVAELEEEEEAAAAAAAAAAAEAAEGEEAAATEGGEEAAKEGAGGEGEG